MRQSSPGKPDFVLLSLASVLVVFGLIVLSSASSVVAFDKWGNSFYLVKHQIFFGLIPGLIFFIVALRTPYIFWRKIALPFLGVTVALLILILIPGFGSSLGGSRSWLILGGVSFQPSELAKIVMIFYLAAWFERKDKMVKDFGYGFVPFLCILGMIVLLLVLQPDVGTMTIVVAIAMIMYFVAGAAWRHVVAIGGLGLALLGILIKFAPYRAARLMTFVRPELDPQGVGYHINQALLAVGSGGFFGLGFGQSRQKFRYLPEVSGDSIFAVMAEELGFFITAAFIVILFLLLRRLIRLAVQAPDAFSRFVIVGVTAWFGIQGLVNISAMLGLMPLTGLPLPLISYGGTSLALSLFALGVVGNISKYTSK